MVSCSKTTFVDGMGWKIYDMGAQFLLDKNTDELNTNGESFVNEHTPPNGSRFWVDNETKQRLLQTLPPEMQNDILQAADSLPPGWNHDRPRANTLSTPQTLRQMLFH